MKRLNLQGHKFGRLTVICNAGKSKSGHTLLLCRCDCGQSTIVFQSNLGRGNTKSCGCYEKDFPSDYKHGMRHSIEYQTWANMIQRCTNKNRPDYERYGGRGIKVCDEWKNSFESFYKDMGNKPKGKTLDRIDNEGNYEVGNCKWSTVKEQNNNTRRNRIHKLV